MSKDTRLEIIKEIQNLRGRKLITYVTSLRPGIGVQMEPVDVRVLKKHLDLHGDGDGIDIFLITFGGWSTVPWAMANLIREYHKKFSVLIPYMSCSAGTALGLGADEMIMGRLATLSPVDPSVANEFNPEIMGRPIPISVEDISGYTGLLKEKFELKDEKNLAALLDRLPADIRPLALGNAYRHYLKARDDARKLLELHMDPTENKAKIEMIVETLEEKLYFHGHNLMRSEAKKIGLKVINAENIKSPDEADNLDTLLWKLYLEYEKDLSMMTPYKDVLPPSKKKDIPIKIIESDQDVSEYVIQQEWKKVDAGKGALVTFANNAPAVFVPPGNIIPVSMGMPVQFDEGIYAKQEQSYWKDLQW